MTLLEEIEHYFGTKNLYDVLDTTKDATDEQIKKAYRKASLKIHPDRVDDAEKEEATKRFQVLAQVHFILSDKERRNLYDDHGIIANEDSLDSEADWANYWRLLFPKVSKRDIEGFMSTYIGSKEQEEDLVKIYNRFEGDMDKICQTHIGFDEEQTTNDLNRLLEEGKIKKFKKFCDEPQAKKDRRKKRALREAKQAEKARQEMADDNDDDPDGMASLTAMIQKKSQRGFDSMIASLEAKYAKPAARGSKRKRKDDD